MQAIIRRANMQDLSDLKEFLSRANLETLGLTEETAEYFMLIENEDRTLRGTLGIEPFHENGLLRSLVVTPGQAENDILLLIEQALSLAKDKNIKNVFLATNKNTAVPFFKTLGFQLVEKQALPDDLSRSDHMKQILNVDNSIFLKFSL